MRIEELSLSSFRNYSACDIAFSPGVNVIYGENAQGKTNLLEAVFFLSAMRPIRSNSQKDVIRLFDDGAEIGAKVISNGRELSISARVPRNSRVSVEVNGVRIKKNEQYLGLVRTVLFSPDDLEIIKGGPALRRRFLNTAIVQLRPMYYRYLSEYQRLYTHKTRILKDSEEKPDLLSVLDEFSFAMARVAAAMIKYRASFCIEAEKRAGEAYFEISGGRERMTVKYKTVSTVTDPFDVKKTEGELLEHYLSHKNAEIATRSCLSGVHKDDLMIEIDGRDARAFASQGQIRTAALALKLAEREVFFDDAKEYPILLLDDVLSELDEMRQSFVLNRIDGGQVIITGTEKEKMSKIVRGKRFEIKNGALIYEECAGGI